MQLGRILDIILKYSLFLALVLIILSGSCAKAQSAKESEKLVTERQAFRFPQQNFIHPLLSPDDKWVVYHSTEIDWSRQKLSDFLFGRIRTVCWKKIFYTKLGRSDKKLVPFFPVNEKHKDWIVGLYKKWSPDGKVLALTAEINGEEFIVLVSFSGDQPRFMESFKGSSPFFWKSKELLIYIDVYGNIAKKKPGRSPEYAVYFRSSYSGRGQTNNFQVASNGNILYNYNNNSVYMTNLANPSKKIKLFPECEILESGFQNLKLSRRFDLSPSGEHAVFYIKEKTHNSKAMCVLIDLQALKVVDKFSVKKHSKALWSPRGTKLAYHEDTIVQNSDDPDPSKRIWPKPHFFILDLATGQTQDFGIRVSEEFNWTPDEKHILYSSKIINESPGYHESGIFIMRIYDGKDISKVSNISAFGYLTISLSGKYIAWEALNVETFFVVENPFWEEMSEKFQ